MKNITPYLKSLKAFETTARHQSFSGAAKELFVTPAAVGQLVKQLEDQLGVTLFQRTNSGQHRLTLTENSKNALSDIQLGFEYLAKGLDKLKASPNDHTLTLTASPAFAAKWLLPKIEQFYAQYPDIAVRLITDSRPLDFAENGIDAGIRYGKGKWENLQAQKLFDETVYPVCSPDYLQKIDENEPLVLTQAMLIHDTSMGEQTGFVTWQNWFAHAGIPVAMLKQGLQINNSAAVLQAAIDGQGVALARSIMVQDDLAAGRLVRLFPHIDCLAALSYYLVYRSESAELGKIKALKEWLGM